MINFDTYDKGAYILFRCYISMLSDAANKNIETKKLGCPTGCVSFGATDNKQCKIHTTIFEIGKSDFGSFVSLCLYFYEMCKKELGEEFNFYPGDVLELAKEGIIESSEFDWKSFFDFCKKEQEKNGFVYGYKLKKQIF